MPNKNEVLEEIRLLKQHSQDQIRRKYLKDLSNYTKRDVIIYGTAFSSHKLSGIPSPLISITQEDIQGFMSSMHNMKGKELDLILHSPGGSLDTAEQLVEYLRVKYQHIRAIIPQNAMSAATMIACAADEIIMGNHSAIGPIDPQITFPTQNGHFTAAAQAVLDEFNQAREEIVKNPKTAPLWTGKLLSYPHGFLKLCENTIDLSKEKVEKWLATYMFKNANGALAKEIATWLGDAHIHKTHGRPITKQIAKEKGLLITDLESDQKLQDLVLSVYHATMATFELTNCVKIVENHLGKGWYVNVQIKNITH